VRPGCGVLTAMIPASIEAPVAHAGQGELPFESRTLHEYTNLQSVRCGSH
jgi:hypothetical protein